MPNEIQMTNDDVFKALEDAGKKYTDYLKLTECTEAISAYTAYTVVDDYNRDINHPLSLVIRG